MVEAMMVCECCGLAEDSVCYRPHWRSSAALASRNAQPALCAACDRELLVQYHRQRMVRGLSLEDRAWSDAVKAVLDERYWRERIAQLVFQHDQDLGPIVATRPRREEQPTNGDDRIEEVLLKAEQWAKAFGPWDSGNPDHVAGRDPADELYNALVRWARAGRPGIGR